MHDVEAKQFFYHRQKIAAYSKLTDAADCLLETELDSPEYLTTANLQRCMPSLSRVQTCPSYFVMGVGLLSNQAREPSPLLARTCSASSALPTKKHLVRSAKMWVAIVNQRESK